MDNYSSFTVDSKKFGGLKEFTNQLHEAGAKLVLVLFGGLSNEQPPNKYRILASDYDTLIMNGSKVFEAPTKKTSTVFLDWFKYQSQLVWEEGLQDLWNLVPYDGLTLNHNTPTIDCNGGRPLCNLEQKENV